VVRIRGKILRGVAHFALGLVACAVWTGGGARNALAIDLSDAVNPPPQSKSAAETPNRDYNGLPVGGWLLYPSLFVGPVYDDNIFQTQTNRVSAFGVRVTPSLNAKWSNGIHSTSLYGTLDALQYASSSDLRETSARVGLTHNYEAMRDLIFNVSGDYTRQFDILNNASSFNNNLVPQSPLTPVNPLSTASPLNPFAVTPITNPNPYNQFTFSASGAKLMNRAFVSLGSYIAHISYDQSGTLAGGVPPAALSSNDGTIYSLSGRAGYWVGPALYTYIEPGVDQRQYSLPASDSNGYRVVAGVGTDRLGLFRGEVFAGYQAEHPTSSTTTSNAASNAAPVFGSRLSYEPTRYWTLSGALDESLGVSTVTNTSTPQGSAARVTTALLQSTYGISREWTASVRIGYTHAQYVGSSELDNSWLAGASFDYTLWRNIALRLDYQFTKLFSNVPLNSFTRDIVSLGVSYKY
jgi:hypothetical protein